MKTSRSFSIALFVALAFFQNSSLVGCTSSESHPRSDKPNIIIILTDDQPYHTLQYMPNVQSELVEKGVNFTNAYVTTPLCCPSRASILTGQYVHNHGVKTNRAPEGGATAFDDRSTLAVWLHDAGYRTGLLGKYLNGYQDLQEGYIPPGWDDWQVFVKRDPDLGFYYNYTLNENGRIVQYGRDEEDFSTDLLADRATQFIRDSSDQPFFLVFSVFAPHETYQSANRHKDLFKSLDEFERYRPPNFFENDLTDKPAWVTQIKKPDVDYVDKVHERILRSLKSVDDSVDEITSTLDKMKIRENTLIIFMSDNGMSMGNNGVFGKNCPYDACLQVPFVVSYPPITSVPRMDEHLVLNIDIAPTLIELAGVNQSAQIDGQSFLPILSDPTAQWRDGFLIEHFQDLADVEESGLAFLIPGYIGFRTTHWKYVEYDTGERELYDLLADPFELENIASQAENAQTIEELLEQIQVILR